MGQTASGMITCRPVRNRAGGGHRHSRSSQNHIYPITGSHARVKAFLVFLSNRNLLHLIERDLVGTPVIELRRTR
jgi:hypothetical protein